MPDITNKTLTDPRYTAVYTQMLESVRASASGIGYPLCSFWPTTGRDYGRGLKVLVLGRAVNGGSEGSDPVKNGPSEAAAAAQAEATNGLGWVTRSNRTESTYNPNLSQFWMTARDMFCELVSDLEASGTEWVGRLAWSNVAKVAPAKEGNPNSRLWKPQAEACRELLQLELELLAPDLVLAFAGWNDWVRWVAPEGLEGHLRKDPDLPRHFQRSGRDDSWTRPYRRPQDVAPVCDRMTPEFLYRRAP